MHRVLTELIILTADPTAPPIAVGTTDGPSWLKVASIFALIGLAVMVVGAIGGLGIMMAWKRGNMQRSGNSAGVLLLGLFIVGLFVTAGAAITFGQNLVSYFLNF